MCVIMTISVWLLFSWMSDLGIVKSLNNYTTYIITIFKIIITENM